MKPVMSKGEDFGIWRNRSRCGSVAGILHSNFLLL